ncbi:MAG: discoidin domain-containing protein [Deltaproteobacteria bacterium]|nr:discoidin domain-containing protein [Deltaproteobacteria bacterium]
MMRRAVVGVFLLAGVLLQSEFSALAQYKRGGRGDAARTQSTYVGTGRQSGLTNLARGKPTSQSSTGWGGTSNRAVDGNTSGQYGVNSTTHTQNDPQAWWQVDLGSLSHISSVAVWNRTDCCSARLANFDVKVSDDGQTWQSYYFGGQAGSPTRVNVGRTGRFVRVQLRGTNYLALAEVEVFGTAAALTIGTTIATTTATTTSTTSTTIAVTPGFKDQATGTLARAITASNTVTSILATYVSPGLTDMYVLAAKGLEEYDALKKKYTGLGDLVDIGKIREKYFEAVKKGTALPGEKDPTSLDEEKCTDADNAKAKAQGLACRDPLVKYRQLLPDVNNFADYAWRNVLGHRKQAMQSCKAPPCSADGPGSVFEMAVDLLNDYGCRAISRRMPGYARIIKFEVPGVGAGGLMGDWEKEPLGDDETCRKRNAQGVCTCTAQQWEAQGKCPSTPPPPTSEYDGPPKKEVIEVCVVTHRQLGETLRKDLGILVVPLLFKPGQKEEPPIAVSDGYNDDLIGEVFVALSNALRINGKPISAPRTLNPNNYCKRYGLGASWPQFPSIKKIGEPECQTKLTVGSHSDWTPACSDDLVKQKPRKISRKRHKGSWVEVPQRPVFCRVDWGAACQEMFRIPRDLTMTAKLNTVWGGNQADWSISCEIHPINAAGFIGGVLSHLDVATLFPGNDDLNGQTFSMISQRLAGFTRKGGQARVFEAFVQKADPKTIRLPESNIPPAFQPDARDQNEGSQRRVNRAVLRRFVGQWTDGYEYKQMTSYLRDWKAPGSARSRALTRARAMPRGGASGSITSVMPLQNTVATTIGLVSVVDHAKKEAGDGSAEVRAALAAVSAKRKDSAVWDYYRAVEKWEQGAFWKDCKELREVCQMPQSKQEREACSSCADEAVKNHCIEGKDPATKGCKGRKFANWIGENIRAFMDDYSEVCMNHAIRTTAIRLFLGVPNPPKSKEGGDTNLFDVGMRFFNALPISAWQRCYLWTPMPEFLANPKICDDAYKDPANAGIDKSGGSFQAKYDLMKRVATDWPWAINKAPIFFIGLHSGPLQGIKRQAPGSFSCDYEYYAKCQKGAHLACAVEDAHNANQALNDQASSGVDMGQVGSDIGDGAEPIVGKLLGLLINAAGMTEMMKTLASAAGLTPEQASDCEDPEYRVEQMKITAGSFQDNKRGCLTKVFAKNFGDVLESIIIMLGNKLVDWGIDLLKSALKGAKASLISAAGSVPFVGGVLAVIVDITWDLVFDVGIKMLLKGVVIAQLPKWLKVKELSKLTVEQFDQHPILTVVVGTVLQLISAAVQYGNKSWIEVGAAQIITAIQKALEVLARQPGDAGKEARFWHRALTFAKKDFTAKKNEGASPAEMAKELLLSMVKGFEAAVSRNITNDALKSRFKAAVQRISEKVAGMGGLDSYLSGNVLDKIKLLLKDLADVVVPLVLSFAKIPPWMKEMVEAVTVAFLTLTETLPKVPEACDVVGQLASIAKPLGEPLVRMAKIGHAAIEKALGNAYGKFVGLFALDANSKCKTIDPATLSNFALDLLDEVPPIVAGEIRDARLDPEKKLLEGALKELIAMVRAKKTPTPPDLLKMLGKLLKDYAPARVATLLQGTGLEDLAADGARGLFGDNGPFAKPDGFFGSPPKWFSTPEAKATLATLRERLGQLLAAQEVGESNPAVMKMLTSALGLVDPERIAWLLREDRPISEAFSEIVSELGNLVRSKFAALFSPSLQATAEREFKEIVGFAAGSCRGDGAWASLKAKVPQIVDGVFDLVKRFLAERISNPTAKNFVGGLLDLARVALKNPAAFTTDFVTFFKNTLVETVPPGFGRKLVDAVLTQLVAVIKDPSLASWNKGDAIAKLAESLIGADDIPPFLKGIYNVAKGQLFSHFGSK